MNDLREFKIFAESFCTQDGDEELYSQLLGVINLFKIESNHSLSSLESLGLLVNNVLKKALLSKRVTVIPGRDSTVSYNEELMRFQKAAIDILRGVVSSSSHQELQVTSLKSLLSLLLIQCKFQEKSKFPIDEFSLDLECMVRAENNADSMLKEVETYLGYQDVAAGFWETLRRLVLRIHPLQSHHVSSLIALIDLNKEKQENLSKTISGRTGKYDKKKVGAAVRCVWERMSSVEISQELRQKLSLCLIEHMMPIIDKPVVLTDYFMSALSMGGPNALIALQGIFNLIQKFNINYPNVYEKLYTMFEPGIFETPYKSRFYYLSDIFLTSLCLPEGMVAGFIKRLSRLSLYAPPEDAVILMALITNLLIRHPNLKHLINSPSSQSVDTDPYDSTCPEPGKCGAADSSLWEVKLLQEHCLPSVGSASAFVDQPLPSVERDISKLLDTTSDLIFSRECKKKLKGEVPVNFEKPFSIRNPEGGAALDLWSF